MKIPVSEMIVERETIDEGTIERREYSSKGETETPARELTPLTYSVSLCFICFSVLVSSNSFFYFLIPRLIFTKSSSAHVRTMFSVLKFLLNQGRLKPNNQTQTSELTARAAPFNNETEPFWEESV